MKTLSLLRAKLVKIFILQSSREMFIKRMDRNLRRKILKFAGGFKVRNLKFYRYGILKFSPKFAASAFKILKFYGLEF
ncbi:MAG: hypothetical protein ACFNVQ_00545 [Campylobacter sp.]